MQKLKIKKNNKKAFAILFAVLLSSFLITLGLSIFSVSLKEIQIATSARDSQIAYYVADSARECALYLDVKQGAFPACLNSVNPCAVSTSSNPTVTCNGKNIQLNFTGPNNNLTFTTATTTNGVYSNVIKNFFQASSTVPSAPVSDIMISKYFNGTDIITTTIEAYGHNTSILGRRVERGIQQINNN